MKKKILTMKLQHETNSFCPAPANKTAFQNALFSSGMRDIEFGRGRGTDMGGMIRVFDNYPDFEIIHTVSMFANPSGPVTADMFDHVVENVKATLAENGPVDGMCILFHGAMVAEGHPDAEGDLLEIFRELMGDIPIIASLDLHANVTPKMARLATALIPFECYPHIDVYDTAVAAAQLLADTLEGKINPVMAYRRIPHLLPLFPTTRPEIRPLYDLAAKLQEKPGALHVRFTHGFFASDFEELGMAALVITDGDKALAESIADELAAAIDREKDSLREDYPTLDEALDKAIQPGEAPFVIADTSDNPGGGGLGDTTHILRRILERGITGGALAMIVDPEFVKLCINAGVGATVEGNLGGWSDPAYSGGPLPVTAYVRALTDGNYVQKGQMSNGALIRMGKSAVVEIGGNLVIVASLPTQPYDLEVFRRNGIEPADQKFLIVKSAIHYRASYGTVAREMVAVPLPGYIPPLPELFTFRNWKG